MIFEFWMLTRVNSQFPNNELLHIGSWELEVWELTVSSSQRSA